MSAGYGFTAAFGAARGVLLAGVSAAAILAAGPVYSQTTPQQFTNDGEYYYSGSGSPQGSNVSPSGITQIPGLTPDTSGAYVVTSVNNNGPVTTTNTGALGANGVPQVTYASESAAAGAFVANNTQASSTLTGAGGTWTAGDYLISSSGAMVQGTIGAVTSACGNADGTGCTWVAPTAANSHAAWTTVTYSQETAYTSAAQGASGQAGKVLVNNSTGAMMTATYATANSVDLTSGTAPTGWTWTGAGAADVKATAASVAPTYYAFTQADVATSPAPVVATSGAASTTSLPGGVVYANSAGNYAAIGPDGSYFHGASSTWTDGTAAGTTVINNGVVTAGTSVTVGTGSNTTAIVGNQVTIGGTAGGTYGMVVNGNSTVPGTISVGVNSTQIGVSVTGSGGTAGQVASVGTMPGGNMGVGVFSSTSTPEFIARSDGYISAEGNRIQGVGTPILGTDAANKAYVDKGLNKAYEGTALALAISQPMFLPGQSFALRAGWGGYESQNAFGVSAAGVIARDMFGYGSTVALDGGIGVGGNSNSVAGKAGITIGFGGGVNPLK